MSSPSDLTLDRWSQLEALFDQAVDLDPVARDTFLTENCGEDEALRREVLALLQANDTGGARVQNLIKDAASKALTNADALTQRIGPYELIRAIGSGGMGSVHLAERKDAEFTQRVAIKVLHKTMVSTELLARFRSERQILADLNHPNIAHLIDGGTTDDGVPYIVMEYVEGKPINQYCDDNQLTINERLDLFRQVCSAIEMAHQNLIVHRDIKPNNILVARDGTPKLLDFGIAKSLSELAENDDLTRHGDRLLTPNHASPEQVAGKPITTASDVYSLGVLLYELLCGVCPFSLNRCTPAQMERIVTQVQAEAPSRLLSHGADRKPEIGRATCHEPEAVAIDRGISIERLRRELAGDLDNIVLMALHKDRDRRYRSVGRLSEDVQRYLRGLPVAARADSWRYRAEKFVRRNRLAVGTAAAFLVCLVAFSLFVTVQANRLAKKNNSLQAAKLYVRDIVFGADPFRSEDGNMPDMLQVLETAAQRLAEPSVPMAPEDVADMEDMLGRVYYRYGREAEARDYLTRSYRRMEQVRGENDSSLVMTLVALGRLETEMDDSDSAHKHLSRALRISEQRKGGAHEALALSQHYMGNYHRSVGNKAQAEALYRASLSTYDAMGGQFNRGKAMVLRELGVLLGTSLRVQEAIVVTNKALEIDLIEFGPKHMFVAHDYENLGRSYQALGQLDKAAERMLKALAIHESWASRSDSSTVRDKLAKNMRNLAELRLRQSDYVSAMVLSARSFVLSISVRGSGRIETARSMLLLARSLDGQGRHHEAASFFSRAIAEHEATVDTTKSQLAEVHQHYGRHLLLRGKLDEAEHHLKIAISTLAGDDFKGYWNLGQLHSDLAAVYIATGLMDQAQMNIELGLSILNSTNLDKNHLILRTARSRMQDVLRLQRESAP